MALHQGLTVHSQMSGAKIKQGWSCLQSVALILEGHLSCFPTSRDNITRMTFPCHMNAACSIRIASSSTNNSGISVKHIVHRTTSLRNAPHSKKRRETERGVSLLRHLGPQLQCGRKQERVCAVGRVLCLLAPWSRNISFAAVSATIKPFSKILAVEHYLDSVLHFLENNLNILQGLVREAFNICTYIIVFEVIA